MFYCMSVSLCLFVILVMSHFGFDDRSLILILPVHEHCFPFLHNTNIILNFIYHFYHLNILSLNMIKTIGGYTTNINAYQPARMRSLIIIFVIAVIKAIWFNPLT